MPAERLHELRRRRAELVAKMQAIVKQEDELEEGQSLDDATAAQFEELKVQLAELDGRIQRIEAALAAAAASATDGEGEGNGDDEGERGLGSNRGGFRARAAALIKPHAKKGPGLQAARFCYGLIYARYHNLSLAKAAEFIENRFGDGDVAKALNSSITGEGGALIPQDFLADLIELLRANTVVRASDPMTVGMPMGNLTIPRLAGGASAAYQGELDDIQISQERFDDVNFVAKKLTSMVPVSNDLIRRAPIGVEEIVRDDLVQTMARREDLAFLRGDGTAKDPVGFKSLVLPANVIPIAAMADPTQPGEALTAILAAASAALLALRNGMSRMIRPTWIMAPTTARFIATARDQIGGFYYKDEMAAGMWEGYPVRQTQQIPTNLGVGGHGSEIYFADFADVVIADTYNVIVDASDVAAYNDGTSMVSAFQRDQSLFRVIGEHDFNMRHLQSLVVLTTTDWTFPGVPGLPGAPWSTQPLNPTWSQAAAIRPALATGANPPPALTDPT